MILFEIVRISKPYLNNFGIAISKRIVRNFIFHPLSEMVKNLYFQNEKNIGAVFLTKLRSKSNVFRKINNH